MLASATAANTTNAQTLHGERKIISVTMERRESSSSSSSLEHLDLDCTPKKVGSSSPDTSTPQRSNSNGHHLSNTKLSSLINPQIEHINSQKKSLIRSHLRLHDTDESNDYDDDESPDEQRSNQKHTSRSHRHHKKRSTTSRLDKNTSVHLEYNMDNPSSLRKKFRFNRSVSASEPSIPLGRSATCSNNESGFVDISCSSYFLNASTTSNNVGASAGGCSAPGTVSASASLTASHSSSAASSPRNGAGVTSSSVSSPESGIGERDREDIKFVCTICDVVSATRHEFTNHIRCHNYASGDTENFTCAICSKVLSSASSLDRHVLVHTGERPFNCKYCHLTFTTNGNMHRHMRTHKQHQHNHHHRHNSNGNKNSDNNSNNAGDVNAATSGIGNFISATATTFATSSSTSNNVATYAQLSSQMFYDGFKAASTAGASCTATLPNASSPDICAVASAVHAGVNSIERRLNSSGVESCESDGGCSTDSSSAISRSSNNHTHNSSDNISDANTNTNISVHSKHNNNCSNINNNNDSTNANNTIKSAMLSNFKRKCNSHLDTDDVALIKRRVKTTINNNLSDEDEVGNEYKMVQKTPRIVTSSITTTDSDEYECRKKKDIAHAPICPVCNASEFTDMQALDTHLDSEHSDIPAKCRHCEVVFRTHHQLNLHPCTHTIRTRGLSEVECSKCSRTFTESDALELHSQECNFLLLRCAQSLCDTSAKPDMMEGNDHQTESRESFFRQLYLQSKSSHLQRINISTSPQYSVIDESFSDNRNEIKLDNEQITNNLLSQLSHDPKDLADIQSILNMTSSSSASNFLKTFEQSVNTPSSNYSLDKDEEEAQDAFMADFRKMKLRGEFPCKLCSAIFPNLRALKGHNRVHLSAVGPSGPFLCNMCPYSICDKAALVRHMRTHNGDRPYECAECNYAFTTKANCERHLRNRHAKTTREEVKRAIIYHPSEDSSCEDPTKKMSMLSSPDFADDVELKYQHQPEDRSTPVSHLKEMLTCESPTTKPIKIQVKSLEQLLDKPNGSIGSNYNTTFEEKKVTTPPKIPEATPIDLSVDVLDLSKKPTNISVTKEAVPASPLMEVGTHINKNILGQDVIVDLTTLEKNHQLLLTQERLINEAMPNIVDPSHYLQQIYRNLVFQPLHPFFLQNLNDFQKFAPLMNRMFAEVSSHTAPTTTVDVDKANMNTSLAMMPQISPLMLDKTSNHSFSSASPSSINPILSKPQKTPVLDTPLNISRISHIPPTVLSGGPVKMVIKNGVLMPKQKQRRYRTERPFACEHCSARFTLRSNMERHVKQQHPLFYAQRQRSSHHIMRGRGATTATTMNNITHLHAAFSQPNCSNQNKHGFSSSPISEHVKYAILAQQLKVHKDTDLLQQALAHGSKGISSNNQILRESSTSLGSIPTKNQHFPFNPLTISINSSMEDDEPKLIIDEDDEDDMEKKFDDNADEEEDYGKNMFISENHLPTSKDAARIAQINETAIKVPKKHDNIIREENINIVMKNNSKKPKSEPLQKDEAISVKSTNPTSPTKTIKPMIARAESVGKSLKDVTSSPFKDESQDLVPVSKLVDNATNNSVSFNNYFRRSDVANHMEQSDEEGLVASGSTSESNNSGTEDIATAEPKKKSAYSSAPNRVSCPYCQRMFPWSSSLRRHILTHTGQKPFKCSHCPLLFTTKSNCDRHLLRKHGDIESAVSVYVPTEDVNEPIPVPKSVEEIEQQQRQLEEERRRKSEAALLQRQRRDKEQHLLQEQERQKQLLKQLSTAEQQLNSAISTYSGNVKTVDLNTTVPSTELPFKCHLCENSFGDRNLCLEHIKAQHAQEFTLLFAKGTIANESEISQAQLIEEEERRNGDEAGTGCTMRSNSGKFPDYHNRKVICAFCMRRFWSTEDLRRHMRTHTGERPFQCEICFRKFTLKHSMLRHMKKHNNRHNNSTSSGDLSTTGNSGSDYSDDEQTSAPPTANVTSIAATVRSPKVQDLLNKANEWRCIRRSGEHKENISEDNNGHQSDLIGNLLGISDQGILNKLLSSADEAAKLLGVEK